MTHDSLASHMEGPKNAVLAKKKILMKDIKSDDTNVFLDSIEAFLVALLIPDGASVWRRSVRRAKFHIISHQAHHARPYCLPH